MTRNGASSHTPVLLAETLEWLAPRTDRLYVDATLGGGGHTAAILEASAPGGRLVAFDRDLDALHRGEKALARFAGRVRFVHGSFADLGRHLRELSLASVDGIVADLGLSSVQLDDPDRGFAFSSEGPLDMRFDRSSGPSAADLVNELDAAELEVILREHGDERRARAIARRIVDRRPLRTTTDLRKAVVSVLGPRRGRTDPATRTFQALRVAVNQEIDALEALLDDAPDLLAPSGRLVVIAYHSIEDRAVKWAFRARARSAEGARRYRALTKKPVVAGTAEVRANPRARSAKLRVLERTA